MKSGLRRNSGRVALCSARSGEYEHEQGEEADYAAYSSHALVRQISRPSVDDCAVPDDGLGLARGSH
jgi:hypothetical protein